MFAQRDPGTPVNLKLEIGFDVNIAAAVDSSAGFRMVLNNNFLFPFDIRIATNGLDNVCHDLPSTAPCMSGTHSGVWTQIVEAAAGPNNRLTLLVTGGVSNGGGWMRTTPSESIASSFRMESPGRTTTFPGIL